MGDVELSEAVEIVRAGSEAPVLLTCEHASERMPQPWRWSTEDERLRGTHWAHDLGAADLARELARAWRATAVLSRFSRLLVDPNREPSAPDLVLENADGVPVALNVGVDETERERRLERLYRPYHDAVARELGASKALLVLSIHSFTPVWKGVPREVEVGVLFDLEEELAEVVRAPIAASGFVTRMNEPYSGRAGLIYSAHRHATERGVRALEIELRQDLAVDPTARERLIRALGLGFSAPGFESLRARRPG